MQMLNRQAFVARQPLRSRPCGMAQGRLRHPSRRLAVRCALPAVMVNSCTGKMGHAAAEAIVKAGLELVPYTFTGFSAGVSVSRIGVQGIPVELVGRDRRQQVMDKVKNEYPDFIVVDYTTPVVVNDNAAFYARNGISFVMGTTGGDRQQLLQIAANSTVYSLVSPQLGRQVAAFQAMIQMLSDNFPGSFQGYTLEMVESHQASKVDTSGTARHLVGCFQALGVDFQEASIRKVRDRTTQLEVMGVPEQALDGHAFHTYRLRSSDGSVEFCFKHNCVGRSIYAEGTVDGVLFLAAKRAAGAAQRTYDMVDVLREGEVVAGMRAEALRAQLGRCLATSAAGSASP